MLTKAQAKYIQNLGHKKLREDERLFIAEGPKLVHELLNESTVTLHSIYATETFATAHPGVKNLVEIDEKELERISFLSTPNQVIALFHQPVFPKTNSFRNRVSLMLDTIQDPGNMGTIIRIADWFGIGHIICSMDCADAFAPKVVQGTMGSIVRVQLMYTDLMELIKKTKGLQLYAAALDGKAVNGLPAIQEGVIVIGNESKGIRPALLEACKHRITIPRIGHAESLNAAVATGIILSHLIKGN